MISPATDHSHLLDHEWTRSSIPWLRAVAFLHDECRQWVSYAGARWVAAEALALLRTDSALAARTYLRRCGLPQPYAAMLIDRMLADPKRRLL